MVKSMPCDAAGGVALRPAFLDERASFRGSLQGVGDRRAKFSDRPMVVSRRRREAKPELSHVGALSVTHVISHFVPVTAAAARTLA